MKGSTKPKGNNTYKAPDGLYYDPSQLETYFIEKNIWNTVNSDYISALKELYQDDIMDSLINDENPFVKFYEKSWNKK